VEEQPADDATLLGADSAPVQLLSVSPVLDEPCSIETLSIELPDLPCEPPRRLVDGYAQVLLTDAMSLICL
jgi:hypothetical protein